MTDTEALDAIAVLMSGAQWTPDTLQTVADIVRLSGRLIEEPTG